MRKRIIKFYCGIGCLSLLFGCDFQSNNKHVAPTARKVEKQLISNAIQLDALRRLSDYGFFEGRLSDLKPAKQVYHYAINTPLFSDYAEKERFIYLPTGKKMEFRSQGPFDFPDGAVLIKNFYYNTDRTEIYEQRKILETRLLIKENEKWSPLTYIWNTAQSDAYLNVVGKTQHVNWIDKKGNHREVDYVIPNRNQCIDCHNANNSIVPIGTSLAQLNQRYQWKVKDGINQLDYFKDIDILSGLSHAKEYDKMPIWDDPSTGNLDQRSRAYLDANCAHCHSSTGSAKNSGLYLNYNVSHPRSRGIFKPPVAAGKGSGNRSYGIVPGKPEESIFIYRMKSNDPAIRMPEIGRTIAHEEGIALLTSYIQQLSNEF